MHDVAISDLSRLLEERQAAVKSLPVKLSELQVGENGRFRVGDLDLVVAPDDEHPLRQLCSSISMGFGFYRANPSALNSTILQTRFKGDDKGERVLRYRKTAEGNRLLAVLPTYHTGPSYVETIHAVERAVGVSGLVRSTTAERVDQEHRLSLRVSFPDLAIEDDSEDPLELGLLVDVSEDGLGRKMQISALLYQIICANGAIATYNHRHLFEFGYRGVAKFAIDAMMGAAIERFGDDMSLIRSRVSDARREPFTKDEAIEFVKSLETRRDVSITFLRRVRKELLAREAPGMTKWAVMTEITQQAQRLHHDARLKHETVAGRLLGLTLPEILKDDEPQAVEPLRMTLAEA